MAEALVGTFHGEEPLSESLSKRYLVTVFHKGDPVHVFRNVYSWNMLPDCVLQLRHGDNTVNYLVLSPGDMVNVAVME